MSEMMKAVVLAGPQHIETKLEPVGDGAATAIIERCVQGWELPHQQAAGRYPSPRLRVENSAAFH